MRHLGAGFYNAGAAGEVAPVKNLRHPAGGLTPTGESRHLRRFCADATEPAAPAGTTTGYY